MADKDPKRTEKDKNNTEQHEEPALCFNNCGFFGSSATMNLCSKCYKEFMLNKAKVLCSPSANPPVNDANPSNTEPQPTTCPPKPLLSRCHACNKRVGLLGFSCRCGNTYCSKHRYFNEHNCQFDYKKLGRDIIAKENPPVKPKKIDKI